MAKKNGNQTSERKNYVVTAFGFPVVLSQVQMKTTKSGVEYPAINMSALKETVVKSLLMKSSSLTGKHIKFLRTYLNFSIREMASVIGVPHATLASRENLEGTAGLRPEQERRLRAEAVFRLLERERARFFAVTQRQEFQKAEEVNSELSFTATISFVPVDQAEAEAG